MSYLVYEDKPKYDVWVLVLLGGVILLPFVLGLMLVTVNSGEALAVFGVALFEMLLFRLILPRRFQILGDKVKIVLGGPLSINIPLSDISDVRSRKGIKAFVYTGIKFATSASRTLEIARNNGLNILISPANPDEFLEQLDRVRNTASGVASS